MSRVQGLLGAACASVCSVVATVAYAQAAAQPSAAAPTADAQGGSAVAEVVVTAQRRNENLQNVPISVTAASAAQLERAGVQSTGDLAIIAPAVHVSTGLGGAVVSIRGIGGTGSGADEPANAIYLDGVYQSSPTASLFSFNNIERIEVLKGPQGTLFGRNAAGGLIQIITPQPKFKPELDLEAGYGNYDTAQGALYVTGPINDKVAIDLAANVNEQYTGWGKNTVTGRDAYKGEYGGARSKLLWNIDNDTSLTITGSYSKAYAPSLQGGGLLPGEATVTGFHQGNFFDIANNIDDRVGTNQTNVAVTLKHDFGVLMFTSITSHDQVHFGVDKDLDISPVPVLNLDISSNSETYTQELQLASEQGSPVTWVVGAFYYHNSLLTDPLRVSGLAVAPLQYADTFSDAETTSYAAYGQATFTLLEGTHLTTGFRYTIDQRNIDFTTSISDPSVPTQSYPAQSVENEKPTWRLALDRQFTPAVLGYLSYSRGFKSGLFNATNPGLPAVRPETVDAYEIGVKSELFSHRLRANVSLFDNELSDTQLRGIPNGETTPIFYNAANSTLRGVDLELEAAPVERLHLQLNASYLDGSYGSGFTNALFYFPSAQGGLAATIGDASGKRTVLSPRWATTLSAQYQILTPAGDVELAGAYNFNDSFYFDPQNRVQQPSYSLLNASVSWRPRDNLELRIWGSNLTDRHYLTNVEPSNFGDEYYPAAPRTFGATVKLSFK